MDDTRDVVVLGPGPRKVIGHLGTCLSGFGYQLLNLAVSQPEPCQPEEEWSIPDTRRRRTGVAKDRRLARKKRAKKLARRR